MRVCSVDRCGRPHRAKGYCRAHYLRQWRHDDLRPDDLIVDRALTSEERFWPNVQPTGFCWLWTAGQNGAGYGSFSFEGRDSLAHRVAYELLVGPIPEGLVLDHLCRITLCVNPDHLDPVTQAVNMERGRVRAAKRAITHCPSGHEYAGRNLYTPPAGGRYCRTCINERGRAYRARKKEMDMKRRRPETIIPDVDLETSVGSVG